MYSNRLVRRAFAGLATAAASAALLFAPAGAAQAHGVGVVVCQGYAASTYQPGLTTVPRPVTIAQNGVVGPCAGDGPGITPGRWELTAHGQLSCLSGSADGVRTIHWDNGESSVEDVRLTVGARPDGQAVLLTEGRITSGRFAGATTRTQAVQLNTDLLGCHTPQGVTGASGPRIVEFFTR